MKQREYFGGKSADDLVFQLGVEGQAIDDGVGVIEIASSVDASPTLTESASSYGRVVDYSRHCLSVLRHFDAYERGSGLIAVLAVGRVLVLEGSGDAV
jgi:hypothetical protein